MELSQWGCRLDFFFSPFFYKHKGQDSPDAGFHYTSAHILAGVSWCSDGKRFPPHGSPTVQSATVMFGLSFIMSNQDVSSCLACILRTPVKSSERTYRSICRSFLFPTSIIGTLRQRGRQNFVIQVRPDPHIIQCQTDRYLLNLPNHVQQFLMDHLYHFEAEKRQSLFYSRWNVRREFGLIYEREPFIWRDWIDEDITVDVYGVGLWEDGVLILEADTMRRMLVCNVSKNNATSLKIT